MVGTPGSSKGCKTCRRRKIACDQQRPDCDKCLRTNRVCERYDRSNPAASSSRCDNLYSVWSVHDTIVDVQPGLPPNDQLFHVFLEGYRGRESSTPQDSKYMWLTYVAKLQNPPVTLHLARLALSLNRAGWQRSDPHLVEEGQKAYTQALAGLSKALDDDTLLQDDNTLVTGMVLHQYELYQPTSIQAWSSHQAGISNIILRRGPEALSSPLVRSVVDHFRGPNMYHSIQYRKSSFLTTPEWRLHLSGSTDYHSLVNDIGIRIAALLEDLDQSIDKTTFWSESGLQKSLLKRCQVLVDELEDVYGLIISRHAPNPIYWTVPAPPAHQKELREAGGIGIRFYDFDDQIPLEYASLAVAQTRMNWLALQLVLSSAIVLICEKAADPDLAELVSTHTPERIRRAATEIIRSVAYCTRDEMGWSGASRCLFSMRVAVLMLRSCGAVEVAWGEHIYQLLAQQKGVGYAMSLDHKLPGVWGEMEARWDET